MFATPPPTSASRRSLTFSGGRRPPPTTVGRGGGTPAISSTPPGGQQEEDPTPPANGGDGEVLTILRNLQQQVSTLQAQQARDRTERNASTPSARTTPTVSPNNDRKLPKELTALVRQTVKQLRDRMDNSMEWDTTLRYTSEVNAAVTAEITKAIANENYSIATVRRATRVYFLTLYRRSKRIDAGKLDESRAKQRRIQRRHNKLRNRRSACSASTSLSLQDKEKYGGILKFDFMSSEITGSESGSGSEMMSRRKVFLTSPLPWRSPDASNIMESLDRKITRRRSDRAKEMCRSRRTGLPSNRPAPQGPAWAIVD